MDIRRLLQHMLNDDEALARFAAENRHLCRLLNDSWQRFTLSTPPLTADSATLNQGAEHVAVAAPLSGSLPTPLAASPTDTAATAIAAVTTAPEPPPPTGDPEPMPRLPAQAQATPIQHAVRLPPLPNASVGQPYDVSFADPAIITVHCPPESGLSWAQGRVCGTPAQAGELVLHIELQLNGTQVHHRQTLHVNPDPKSLWRDLPANPQDPFFKPDQAADLLDTAQGRLLAARVRGRAHAHVGSFCDDDYRLAYHAASAAHILAVSDGAGSAAFSRLGSQLAVNTAADTVLKLLDNPHIHGQLPHVDSAQLHRIVANLFDHALYQVLQAHEQAVAQYEAIPDSKALSSTFLLALALPRAKGGWLTAAYWVGDGAIACDSGQGFVLLGQADSGAYSGETQFLSHSARTQEALSSRTHVLESEKAPLLLLLSDGVSDPKFASDAQLNRPEAWQALWAELQAPLAAASPHTALQDWLGFWSPGNHDDRTLALFTPRHPECGVSGSPPAARGASTLP